MKKILIGIDSLRLGGIQTALINMLWEMDLKKYDVTLKVFHYQKEYEDLIPSEVKILRSSFILDVMNMTASEAKKKGAHIYFLRRLLAAACWVFGANKVYSLAFIWEKNRDEYDVAISYTNNGNIKSVYYGMNKFILEKISARQKYAWVHVDYKALGMNRIENNREYTEFEKIVHVSNATKQVFLEYMPELRDKCTVIYNFVNPRRLIKMAGTFKVSKDFTIITVGRMDKNKNLVECIEIAALLSQKGIEYRWLLVGDGPDYELIRNKIKEYGLEEKIRMLGNQRNPYSFMANASLYVSTSKTESFGLAIHESINLGVPALAYAYPAVYEIIDDGVNGYVIENSIDEMVARIFDLIENTSLYNDLKTTCKPKFDLEAAKLSLDVLLGENINEKR